LSERAERASNKDGKNVLKNVVNTSNIVGHISIEIYDFVAVLFLFALFAFHVPLLAAPLAPRLGGPPPVLV